MRENWVFQALCTREFGALDVDRSNLVGNRMELSIFAPQRKQLTAADVEKVKGEEGRCREAD
jgi:hypothetical protein